jgi:hypothetical protein
MNNTSNNKQFKREGRSGRSILNGLIGEYLEKDKNPLAISMGFYHRSQKLSLDSQLAYQLNFPLSNRVVVLVHGLAQLETVWNFPEKNESNNEVVSHYIGTYFERSIEGELESYGSKLQKEFGYTPLYLRYNTGLSVEKNGRNFASQLSKLFRVYPLEIKELMLIGFSMGGGLLRSAQYTAQRNQLSWLASLSKCIYLGNINEAYAFEKLKRAPYNLVKSVPFTYIKRPDALIDNSNQGLKIANRASYAQSSRHYFVDGCNDINERNSLTKSMVNLWRSEHNVSTILRPDNSQTARIEGLCSLDSLTHQHQVYQLISMWTHEVNLAQADDDKGVELYKLGKDFYVSSVHVAGESEKVLMAGVLTFLGSVYGKVLESVEAVHYSVATEPFYLAQKLPVVSQIAKPLEAMQRSILNNFYRSLRRSGRLMHHVIAGVPSKKALLDHHKHG